MFSAWVSQLGIVKYLSAFCQIEHILCWSGYKQYSCFPSSLSSSVKKKLHTCQNTLHYLAIWYYFCLLFYILPCKRIPFSKHTYYRERIGKRCTNMWTEFISKLWYLGGGVAFFFNTSYLDCLNFQKFHFEVMGSTLFSANRILTLLFLLPSAFARIEAP